MSSLPKPRHPFLWEAHRSHASFGHAFRLQRGVLVTQSTAEVCSYEAILFVTGCVDAILMHDATHELGGITILHDWRTFRRYDSAARTLLFDTMRQRPKGYARHIAMAVPPTPFWRMAIAGAAVVYAFLRVAPPVLVTDASKLLPLPGVRPEPAPPWFRGAV